MNSPDHVAQPHGGTPPAPPAVSSPSASDAGTFREQVSCLYCGKSFARFCLARHVRAKHADKVVPASSPNAPASPRAARRKARGTSGVAQPPPAVTDVSSASLDPAAAFDAAIRLLEDQGLMVVSCARGLTVLMGKVKSLRKEYIKVRAELTRLQREAAEFRLEGTETE